MAPLIKDFEVNIFVVKTNYTENIILKKV